MQSTYEYCADCKKILVLNKQLDIIILSEIWIRIRMDPHSFSLLDLDPGGKTFQIKTEKMQEN